MASPRKSRKKAQKLQVEHKVYGPCLLVERRATPTGNDILLVEFSDKTTRTLLADPKFWIALPDLGAIPVAKKTAAPDETESELVMNEDLEPEMEIEEAA
jgi:hypothetical protein